MRVSPNQYYFSLDGTLNSNITENYDSSGLIRCNNSSIDNSSYIHHKYVKGVVLPEKKDLRLQDLQSTGAQPEMYLRARLNTGCEVEVAGYS